MDPVATHTSTTILLSLKSKKMAATTNGKTRTELSKMVTLFTTKDEDPVSFTYEVECHTFKACTITLDFEGSENFAMEGHDGLKVTTVIRPFSLVKVCKLNMVDAKLGYSLSRSCEWIMSDPSPEEIAAHIQVHNLQMLPLLKEAHTLSFLPKELDPKDEHLHELCANYGKNFVDKDFPPTITSLFKADTKLLPGEMNGTTVTPRSAVEWKRAREFMEGDYHVFDSGIEPADIKQGNVEAHF